MEYTTTGPAAPTTDGMDETPTEESPLPAGAGDAEVHDDVDDENLDANHDDDAPLPQHERHPCDARVHVVCTGG
jgi:hypothetical protein